jgi:hypothetical protein
MPFCGEGSAKLTLTGDIGLYALSEGPVLCSSFSNGKLAIYSVKHPPPPGDLPYRRFCPIAGLSFHVFGFDFRKEIMESQSGFVQQINWYCLHYIE